VNQEIASNRINWTETSIILRKNIIDCVSRHSIDRWCPICGDTPSKFQQFGLDPREDAYCVSCGALERHRFLWLFLKRMTNLFDGKSHKMLHVAPERCLESRFRKFLGQDYITADLINPAAMVKMDVTDIQYPDEFFDVVYCSHVLEHVPDDKKAMHEFYRVLKQDGWAILLVPISASNTIEDPTITDPKERLRLFGQEDHVRRYGPDYVNRLREAGFLVRVYEVNDLFKKSERIRMGLTPASGDIYFCTKGNSRLLEKFTLEPE
jgi:SAM-dependent methyltransferase